jgi:uncharacterized protein YbaP (TraB family)
MRPLVLGLAVLLGGCANLPAGESAMPAYDLSEERVAAGAPAPRVFLLEKDGATIAVFGTTHLVPERMQWLSPATEAALARSDLILTETSLFQYENVAISSEQQGLLATRSLLPPGRVLWRDAEQRLGKATTQRIKDAMMAAELNPATYSAMRPWLVCRDLQLPPRVRRTVSAEDKAMIAALTDSYGMPDVAPPDLKVEMYGVSNGIETRFLESEYQRAENFSRLSDDEALDCAAQIVTRTTGLRDGKSVVAAYAQLLSYWVSGDVDDIRAMTQKDQAAISVGWARLFLQGREAAWLRQIAQECDAARRDCFIAVGMAHLGGPDGLLKSLEAMGYRRLAPQG